MNLRRRRLLASLVLLLLTLGIIALNPENYQPEPVPSPFPTVQTNRSPATTVLETIPVKGRAPKTGYSRAQFGDGWRVVGGCDTRNIILARDMTDVVAADCKVQSGYTVRSLYWQHDFICSRPYNQ